MFNSAKSSEERGDIREMNIVCSFKPKTIRELVDGFEEDEVTGRVVAFGGNLDIRPAYQREYIYKRPQAQAVIQTVINGTPLSNMYWWVRKDGGFECCDGQQRGISICQFVKNDWTVKYRGREKKSYEIEFEVEIKKKVEDENGNLVEVKEKKLVQKTLGYYLFEDDTYGTVVSYEYQARVMTGETTDVKLESGEIQTVNVYTVYDVESLRVIAEFQNGASRFARKTQEPITGETPIFEKDGYYYYALPKYENENLAASSILYSGKEDSHYDYVRPNAIYRSTDDVKSERIWRCTCRNGF